MGLARRFRLVKGEGRINAPRLRETWPDTFRQKARSAKARGDVPVLILNTNVLKDGVVGDLARDVPGPGFVHLPQWLDDDVFHELTAENRTAKGWKRDSNIPNEAFDLHVYARAACIALGAERINWKKPPKWAQALETQLKSLPPKPAAEKPADPTKRKFWVKKSPRKSWMKR